jgi:uncharacterized protein YjgD (DUF1641 family)
MFEHEHESKFLEVLKRQMWDERTEFLKQLEELVRMVSKNQNITLTEATRLMKEWNRLKDPDIQNLLGKGFETSNPQPNTKLSITKAKFLINIKRASINI